MKPIQNLALIAFVLFVACNNQKNKSENIMLAHTASTPIELNNNATKSDIISSKAAVITGIDSTKKFIRTAQIKSKVNNVLQATLSIEDATIKHGGFVTSSLLQSNTNKVEQFETSADSLQENIYYTTTNTITCRVPNNKLDTLLKDIAKTLVFIDYRNITAEDVTLDFLKNNLVQKRTEAYKNRMNKIADDNTTKPGDITHIADGIINKQEEQDNATIDKLTKLDAIQYSTITLDIYQSEAITKHIIPNFNSNNYQQSFFYNALFSIKKGWFGLLKFISFLLQLWPVYILSFIGFYWYKKYYKNNSKAN
ncbi:MAG: DUF4349 domain-containing protein [Chitinophagaceae bacterium]